VPPEESAWDVMIYPDSSMNRKTYGEQLFESYLASSGIAFEYEPSLPGVSQRIDFVVNNEAVGKILFEVKDIETAPPGLGFGTFDPYEPIRSHIEEGKDKFKATPNHVCVLVLVANPNSFVQLNEPEVILGAMYGNVGFTVPLDTEKGCFDP